MVVEFSVVLGQLVQLLLQVSDDLWGGGGGKGGLSIKKGHCQQGEASRTSGSESCSGMVSHGMTMGTNTQACDLMLNSSSRTGSLVRARILRGGVSFLTYDTSGKHARVSQPSAKWMGQLE